MSNENVEQASRILKESAKVESPEERKRREQMELMMMRQMMIRKINMVQPSGMSMYLTQFDMVCQFHILMDTWRNIIDPVPTEAIERRIKIVDEEVNKELMPLLQELKDGTKSLTLEHRALLLDHLIDSVYVLLGTAAEFGLPFDMGFEIVHQANINKFSNGVKKNEYGKLIKPAGWQPPEPALHKLIQDQHTKATLTNSQEHQELKARMEAEQAASSVERAKDGTVLN